MGQEIKFSEREKQVITLLVQGKSNKQIALALGVSVRAIEFHLSNIYAKLGAASRTEAALKLAEIKLRESTGVDVRESTVAGETESADNGKKSISTRRILMKRPFIIGLGLLTLASALCVGSVYFLAQRSNSVVGALPTPTNMLTIPSPQPTETLTLISSLVPPQPTPQDTLGGGTVFDGPFVFDLRLFRDPSFKQHPVTTSLYSDLDGIGTWMFWYYTGADVFGPLETYWGTLPQLDQLLQETYDSIQLGSSGGRTGGVELPGGFFIPGESKPGDHVQVALKVVTPDGEYGAVIVFTLKQGTNGFEPSDISVDVLKSITSTSTASSKEHILDQIRQLVTEYDQAVQAEKKNGDVEFSKDPQTGEEIFLFKNESYMRIMEREEKLWEDINQLNKLYVQVYRDEVQPTPFPTPASTAEARTQYDGLIQQAEDICSSLWNLQASPEAILVYRPDDGKYLPIGVGDDYARCEVHGQMIEEWRTAPLLAKVNKEADMALIRQIIGKPELILYFQSVSNIANAPWQNAALYTDETGTNYYVDIETGRLATIEPNFPSHPDIPPDETKSMDELRGIARQFAVTNSPRVAELEATLLYEENCKEDLCFFRWDYRNKDWSGTDWAMMPPFLQVGVLTNGQVATYINTLDLFK